MNNVTDTKERMGKFFKAIMEDDVETLSEMGMKPLKDIPTLTEAEIEGIEAWWGGMESKISEEWNYGQNDQDTRRK